MGGNSGIYYGNMVLDYEPDSDQEDFEFKLSDIDGNQVPNADDLILNVDGCFYRVISNERIDDEGNPIIDAKKLTVAGSGGTGGGGGGSTISRITIKDLDGNAQKYYTADVTEAKLRFNVTSTLLEGNSIIEMTYQIGNNVVKEDLEVYPFGNFEFDLMPYFSQLNKSTTNTITIKVIDLAGTQKSYKYYIDIIELSLTSKLTDNILLTNNGSYSYYCTPKGGTKLENRKILYKFYDADGNYLSDLDQNSTVSAAGTEVTTELSFTNVGAYKMEVTYIGNIKNTENIVKSNTLIYQIVYYGESPILVAYMPEGRIEQYDTVDINYLLASTIDTTDSLEITLTKNTEEVKQITKYNELKKWSIYFDASGIYNLSIKDTFNNIIEFNNIVVNEYTGDMPVIDPTQTDLNLSAVNRSNNELNKNSWTYKDAYCTFENFIWGDINGWMKDEENVDMLHLSSGAKLTLENYYPYSSDKNIMTQGAGGLGQTIELDFKISGTTDFTKPLISCLSYTDNTKETIQVGFNITGQESTLNTNAIKATGGVITEGDSSTEQAYNTAIQGLTAKFIENERIHLTWVVERNNSNYPLIITYLNGVLSGITKYGTTDAMQESPFSPAKLIIDSTYGDIDIYNIRIYKKPLDDKAVLDNYIATLPTADDRVNKYNDNNGLLDNDNNISVESIESGDYILSVPYIKIIGGQALSKDDNGYKLKISDSSIQLPVAKKDYRLIEEYVFVDQHGNHDKQTINCSFKDDGYLDKGVVMYGQGTSSMEYPVKNLRFKARGKDENGEKYKFKVNRNDCPVDLVCLKADYMESSGSHNTGTGNLIYDLMGQNGEDYQTPGQKYYGNKVDYDIVTAIRGYPIALFYKGPDDETYEFVGKYNFNLDKATQEPFGFYSTPEEMPEDSVLPNENFGWAKAEDTYTDKNENDEYKFAKNGYVKTIHCYEFLNNASNLANFLNDEGEDFETTFFKTVINDGEEVPNWALSYESRYPEAEEDDFSDIDISSWYRLTSWVNSCNPNNASNELLGEAKYGYTTDSSAYRLAKFKEEFKDYFDLTFTAVYYVLTHTLLMIDSRAKNMMIATWDNKIWFPIFYDMDTMLGLNNYGYNKFSYDVEDKDANIYNGQNSVLWNNFKECFAEEIAKVYNQLRNTGMSYSNLIAIYNDLQADALNEIAANADARYKYIRPFTEGYINSVTGEQVWVEPGSVDYLYAAQGRRSMHRKWWISNRLDYFDGKHLSDAYKNDRFITRLYTPSASEDNYYAVPDLTAEQFELDTYYIRNEVDGVYEFTEATEFVTGITYYKKALNALKESLAVVPPSNNFTLTPLHNQYLSVAYGGANGETTTPIYTKANEKQVIVAPGVYNDTETYIYGGSMLKDLGDLSPQYLGRFVFPEKTTKLETLVLGNKNNKYYNPNFSSLEIGSKAPYLKKLDITNCSGLGNRTLDISQCKKLQELYATGSGITGVTLPQHGVIKELRLPATLNSLTIIDQPYLTDETFTIGSYDSDENTYSVNDYSKILNINIEDVPNLNTYEIVKGGTSLQYYKFINVNWEINDAGDLNEDGTIKVLERLLTKGENPIYPQTTTAQCLTGTLTINCKVEDAYAIYNHYWEAFPELNIIFTNVEKNIYDVNILDGNDNIYWTKKILEGENIDEEFLSSGPNGAFETPTMTSTAQYSYIFQEKWIGTYEDEATVEIKTAIPLLNNITQPITLKPIFDKVVNKYLITIYNGANKLINDEFEYGMKLSEIVPATEPYKNDNDLGKEQTYKFIGYALTEEYANAGLVINNLDEIIVTKKTEYYTSHKIINVYDNILDEKYLIFRESGDGYSISLNKKYSGIQGKITLPTTYNNKPIVNIEDFQSCPNIYYIFFARENRQIKSINYSGGSFQGCNNLRYFEMPDTVTLIGPYSFSGDSMMFEDNILWTESEIENFFKNIEKIENRAFVSTGGAGKTFYFPAELKVINERAFYYAKPTKIVFGGPNKPSQYDISLYDGKNGLGIFDDAPYLTTGIIFTDDQSNPNWDTFKEQIGKTNQTISWSWGELEE